MLSCLSLPNWPLALVSRCRKSKTGLPASLLISRQGHTRFRASSAVGSRSPGRDSPARHRPRPRSSCCCHLGFGGGRSRPASFVGRTAAAGLAARQPAVVVVLFIVVIVVVDPRIVVVGSRSPPDPWARCRAGFLPPRADPLGVGGQDGRPNMLADRMLFIVGAGAADGQLLAAEPPVQDHFVLGLALDDGPEIAGPRERTDTRPSRKYCCPRLRTPLSKWWIQRSANDMD